MTIELENAGPITLTKAQRLMLANQYASMMLIDPKHAKDYEAAHEAVTSGYADAIDNLFASIFDGLTPSQCRLVVRSMAVYDALQRSYESLGKAKAEAAGIDKADVAYPGFDGNNETEYMAYARFLRDYEQRFTSLASPDNCNSHMPMISDYEAMLRVWKEEFNEAYQLSSDQMKRLLEAR